LSKEAEQNLFHLYNANYSVPTWMLEQCKQQRINGIKWGCSIPANANPAVVAKFKISFMIRLKVVELISSVKVGVKVKCAEVNRHDATVNSIPQEEEMQLCLWDVIDVPKINIKKELKVGPAYFLLPYFIPYAPTTWHPISSTTCSTLTPGPPGSRAARQR